MSTVIGNLRVVLGLDSAAFQQGLGNAVASLRGVGKSMQSIGQNMSVAVTAPLIAFGGLSLTAAGNFEAAMNRVRAASGASAAEMVKLEALALKMGETTQFKASEAADAIEILAKNGLDASQILGGALQASMLLAASSGSDLAGAGDLATDVMMNFGKSAEELTGLVDGITGVLLESKFGFEDYRLAIAQAGGVAGGLGVSFEDFNAAIAGTSAAFASGSDAGTAFKTFIQRLVPASAPAADAMRELGLEFFNVDGSMKSMAAVSQELKEGLSGLSEEAKNDALSTIFGTDALRTAIGLANQGADGIDRLTASLAEASATEQAAARLEGFNGEMLKMKSAVEALMIAVANSGILEWATSFAEGMTTLVLGLQSSNPEMLKIGVAVAALTAVVGPVLIGLGLMATAIAAIGAPILAAVAGLAAIGAALYTFNGGLTGAVQAVTDFGTGIRDRFNQISEESGGWGSAFVISIALGLSTLYEAGIEAIRKLGQGMREGVTWLIEDAGTWGRDIAAGLANGITSRAAAVRDSVTNLANNVKGWFADEVQIKSPSKVFHRFGQFITQGLSDGIDGGNRGVQSSMQGMAGGMMAHFDGVTQGARNLADVFGNIKTSFANMLTSMASNMMESGLQGIMGSLFGAIDPLAGALRGAGLNAIPALAGGGMAVQSGLAQINESGGELVSLSRGATVIPHDLSKGMMQGGGQMTIRLQLSGDIDARIMDGADRVASVKIERFAVNDLPSRVSAISQYERDRMA